MKKLPSKEYLNECFAYNPTTGALLWRHRPVSHFSKTEKYTAEFNCLRFNSRYAGKSAGSFDNYGYLKVGLNYKKQKVHRIVWKLITGIEPDNQIDHINGNKSDNRKENLREANHSENGMNTGKKSNNTSGFKGVYWNKKQKKWLAKIEYGYHQKALGSFETPEEAHNAYCLAAKEYHGKFANYGNNK
jgi:hypothetical protein